VDNLNESSLFALLGGLERVEHEDEDDGGHERVLDILGRGEGDHEERTETERWVLEHVLQAVRNLDGVTREETLIQHKKREHERALEDFLEGAAHWAEGVREFGHLYNLRK